MNYLNNQEKADLTQDILINDLKKCITALKAIRNKNVDEYTSAISGRCLFNLNELTKELSDNEQKS